MTNPTNRTGYQTTINGKVAYVVNRSEDGTKIKVVFGRYVGFTGWSGHCKNQYEFSGPRVWVNA